VRGGGVCAVDELDAGELDEKHARWRVSVHDDDGSLSRRRGAVTTSRRRRR
jgi:hypothetical protein